MSDDKKAPPRREGQDLRNRFFVKLCKALARHGVTAVELERAVLDDAVMANIGLSCTLAIREPTSATDSAIDSAPTKRIIPANLVVDLRASPKLTYGQEIGYHYRIPPTWIFDRRQLGLVNPVERFSGGLNGADVWEMMTEKYGRLLPNANILDVFLMYPSLVPAAWNARCFYAFGTKIETDGCEWIRGLRQVRGAWEQVMERLDRPWVPNDMVLIFKTSE